MVGCVAGYSYDSTIKNIRLENCVVSNVSSEMGADMIGGIAGAGMDSIISDCSADAILNLVDGTSNSGIVVGGYENSSIVNCTAKGTVNAGNNCKGIGGAAGCNFGGDKIEGCTAEVEMNIGDNAYLCGGIVGYAGCFGGAVTQISDCSAKIGGNLGSNAKRFGGIIGGGFFVPEYAAYYPEPSVYSVKNCTSSGSISYADGSHIGGIAGNTFLSSVDEKSTSSVLINGSKADICGDTDDYKVINALQGTYTQFFTNGCFEPKYDGMWHGLFAAMVGEDQADTWTAMLKNSMSGKIYGEEAAKKYGGNMEGSQFNCDFTENVDKITVKGNNISGTDKDGNLLFSHNYQYAGKVPSAEMPDNFVFDVYETYEDAGEFKYFAFCPDTPDTTYHIEFRYGGSYDDLFSLTSGKYAYWLAAGIPVDYLINDAKMEKVLALFCTENCPVSQLERSKKALAQLKDLTGRWNCNMSLFAGVPEYANADMYIEFGEDGNGVTYLDMTGSKKYIPASSFMYFAYDTDGSTNEKSGYYMAYTDDEGMETSKYTITETGSKEILDFYDLDGNKIVTYFRNVSKKENNKNNGSSGGGSSLGKGKSSRAASVNAQSDKATVQNKEKTETINDEVSSPESTAKTSKIIVLTVDSVAANISGKSVQLNEAPVIINGRTMVPIRFVSENLGYKIDWEAEEKKVMISLDETVIELFQNNDKAFVNGNEVLIDSPAVNRNGSVLVPLRFIAETLGAEVEWNAADRSVTIK